MYQTPIVSLCELFYRILILYEHNWLAVKSLVRAFGTACDLNSPAEGLDRVKETDSFVRSIERGLAVVEALGSPPGRHTLTEIATLTALNKATARRVLLTLVSLNYVALDGRYYHLQPRALRLGLSYLTSLPYWTHAQLVIEDLRNELGESCSMAVLDGTNIVYTARLPAKRIISANLGIGSRLPAHLVSLGRVLLAALPDEEQAGFLGSQTFTKKTENTVDDPEQLKSILNDVGRDGYAWVDGELDPAICGIAVPLRDPGGRVVAALSVNLISGIFSREDAKKRYLIPLKKAAQEIRAQMS